MKQIIKRGSFLTLMFMLLGCLSLYAADNDLTTKQITIKLEKAGTLPDRIPSRKKYKVTNLKIIGEINGTDLRMIRDMAGSNSTGNSTDGKLSVLDLSEAKIVKGGDCYYNDNYNNNYYTSNDVIGDCAFYDCSGLKSLTLPAGITSIGYKAFWNCSGLKSLTLPASITSIGSRAFDGCIRLKEVRFCINDNLDTYLTKDHPYIDVDCGIKYYINDKEITSIEIPSSVTTLGDCVFQGCSGLTSLTLPAGITKIGDKAFWDCRGLTNLTLSAGITEIGDGAFWGCSGLKEVRFCINDNLDTYLTKGHPYIIADCGIKYYINDKEITSIKIPSNVTTLGDCVFQGCRGLTSLTLPAGITKIGDYAFSDCRGLTSLTLPAGITEIGDDAFRRCSGLTSLTLPAGITSIGDYAFSDCRRLTSLTLPASITEIGSRAFSGCRGLTSLTLPASITEIGSFVFEDCSGLTSLNLPAGITKIGWNAFSGCSGLTSLNLPAGITEICDAAFSGCSGLTSLTLPAGITSIGRAAFYGCSVLTSIYVYAEKVPKIYSDVFVGFDAKKCTLYVPMGTYDDYWLSVFGDYFENIVEFDATGIDKTTISTDVEEVARYSVNGQRLSAPTKGLNIVKYSDGSVKKVAVQ